VSEQSVLPANSSEEGLPLGVIGTLETEDDRDVLLDVDSSVGGIEGGCEAVLHRTRRGGAEGAGRGGRLRRLRHDESGTGGLGSTRGIVRQWRRRLEAATCAAREGSGGGGGSRGGLTGRRRECAAAWEAQRGRANANRASGGESRAARASGLSMARECRRRGRAGSRWRMVRGRAGQQTRDGARCGGARPRCEIVWAAEKKGS